VLSAGALLIYVGCINKNRDGRRRRVIENIPMCRLFLVNNELSKPKYIGNLKTKEPAIWKRIYPPDSLLGWRLAKYVSATHYNTWNYETTKQGFVSIGDANVFYDKNKSSDVYRVIVLGGSTVFGQGAYTPSENIVAQIDRFFKEYNQKRKIETINAGVGGYASNQEFMYLISELVHYKPDLVIIYDGWNDMSYNNLLLQEHGGDLNTLKSSAHYNLDERLIESYSMWGPAFQFIKQLPSAIINDLGEKSAFVYIVSRVTRRMYLKLKDFVSTDATDKVNAVNYYNPKSVTMYKDNLEMMIFLSELYNFKIGIFLQPLKGTDTKTYPVSEISDISVRRSFYSDARNMFNELSDRHSDKDNVCIKDVSLAFHGMEEQVYADSGHLLLRGNKIVARQIVSAMSECGI
jgi:hypothetical protein